MNAPSSIVVGCFVDAVVVAGDRAGADVDVRADRSRRRDTPGASPSSRRRAPSSSARRNCRPSRAVADDRVRCAGARTVRRARRRRRRESVITQWLRTVTRSPMPRVDDAHAAVNLAAAADRRAPFERHAGMDDRVGADLDVAIDVGRRRILDRDAGRHQFRVLVLSHDSAHCRQLRAAVDAANFVGVRDGQRFDAPARAAGRSRPDPAGSTRAARSPPRCSGRASNRPSSAKA